MAWTTPASFAPGQLVLDTDLDLMNANLAYLHGDAGAISLVDALTLAKTTNGNHGLTVSNPSAGSGANALVLANTDSGSNAGLLRCSSTNATFAGANSLNLYTIGAHPIGFVTQAVERMRLDANGLLGLGTTAPQGAFHAIGKTTGNVAQGGFLILEGAAVTSLQTIAASGTITKAATFVVSDYAVGTTTTSGGGTGIAALSGSFTYVCNSDTITVAITAAGAVTVQRTAGANSSHNISMLVVYV